MLSCHEIRTSVIAIVHRVAKGLGDLQRIVAFRQSVRKRELPPGKPHSSPVTVPAPVGRINQDRRAPEGVANPREDLIDHVAGHWRRALFVHLVLKLLPLSEITFNLLLDGETALTVNYDQPSLTAALDLAGPFLAGTPLENPAVRTLVQEQILPLVPAADLDVTVALQ